MKTEYEKCLAGESFIGGKAPKIVETILRTRRLLAQFNATDYADTERSKPCCVKCSAAWVKVCMWILISIANTGNIFLLATK